MTRLTDAFSNPATFPTSAWYVPYVAGTTTASPATLHCDGSVLTGSLAYRVNGSVAPITPAWSNGQDINFDGVLNPVMRGFNDWTNIDLRQVGATGGEFASDASVLSFGNSSAPLNIAAGGSVALGSGGTVALGSGGTVTLGSGGNVTLGSGGTIALGSGGTVTLGSGGNVTLGSGGTVTPGSNGLVTLGSGGNVAISGRGTITLGSGGTVTLGSGGNVTLGSGGTIALGSGGNVTIPPTGGSYTIPGTGGTITLGSGGTVTLGSGGNVTLGSGGVVALGSGGNVTLGSGGNITLGSGGVIALGSGGVIALGSGGNVALSGRGTITLGSGGLVTLGSGGNVTLGSGGLVTLGSGGDVSVGSGGNVTLGSGGTVTLGSGGTVTLGSGGNVTLGSGGNVTLGSGGTITLGSGGNVTLGSGGNVTLGSGGNVTLGSGGVITLGSGGNVILGSGGLVTLGSGGTQTYLPGSMVTIPAGGGTITLGSGGNVTLDSGSGGYVTLGSGGVIALGSGGNITLGSGGNVTLGSGGVVTLGSGGNITLGSGGTVTLGSGGNVTLGSGGIVALGSGGNVTLGSGGIIALGSGGNITLGSGGATSTELTFEIANSVVRPPTAPTETPISAGASTSVRVNWTAPTFGVVSTYTILRSSNGATPIVIGSVSGIGGNPPATTFLDTNPDLTSQTVVYTITTGLVPDQGTSIERQSVQSPPAVLKNDQTIVLGALPSSIIVSAPPPTVTATAQSSGVPNGLQVSFSSTGSCSIGTQSITNGVSAATVTLNSTGSCTIIASQPGTNSYNTADPVSGTFMVLPQGSTTQPQTITFPQLQNVFYGGSFSPSATASSGEQVSFMASGPCTAAGAVTSVGLCTITASAPGGTASGTTYSPASVSQSFTIFPAVIKVTATNVNLNYGQAIPAMLSTYSGFVNSENSLVISGSPALSTTATSTSNPGSYPIVVSTGTLAATNYSFRYINGTLTIQTATPTISIGNLPASGVFGGGFTPTYLYSGTGSPIESVISTTPGVCSVSGGLVSFVGVGPCTLTASATATTDYAAATGTPQTFSVSQATPTISIGNIPASAVYGGSFTPTYVYSGTGSPTKSVASTTTTVCSVSGSTVNFAGLGTCTLKASVTATTDDTAVTGNPQSFTVGKATQTISFTQPTSPVTYPVAAISLSATSTSGLTVAFTIDPTSTGIGTISGSTLTVTGAGTLVIDANQAGNANYQAAAQVQRSIVVNKATQTINFTTNPPASAAYKGTFTVAATASSGLPIAFTSSGSCSNSGATYTMTSGTGTCSVIASQAGNSNYAAATPVTKTVNATTLAQAITFTTNPPASAAYNASFTVAATGGASGNAVTFNSAGVCTNSGATFTMTNSTGPCSVIASQAGNSNYAAATPVTKTVNATGPVLTVSPSNINFGTVFQGSITTKNITVTNTGTGPATINGPILSIVKGGNSNEFVAVNLCVTALAPGKSCDITIAFVAGPYYTAQTATLNVMSNAPGSPQPVALSALVIDPVASFSPTSLSFGTIKHATSSTLTTKLTNTGGTALNFTSIGVTGANASSFVQTNNCGSSVAAGGSCTITVKFTPATTGTFSANLTVVDNAQSGSGTQTVALSGKGN